MNAAYIVTAGTAALFSFSTAPIVRSLLIKRNILDHPNQRSSHTAPVPRGGGIACALGLIAGSLAAHLSKQQVPWPAIAASLVIGAVGLLDDRFHLPPIPRLMAQIVTGATLGLVLGGTAWAIAGAALVPFIVNAVNFMDGINGITGTTLTIWAVSISVAGSVNGTSEVVIIGLLTAGAALGFLPWNATSKARLFLGDVGSYLFGTLAASGILLGITSELPVAPLLAPLALYGFDVAITLLRRALRGAPLFEAHREHIYQRMTPAPDTHLVTTLVIAVLSIGITLAWLLPTPAAVLVTGILLVCYALLPALLHPGSGHSARPSVSEAGH